MRCSRQQLGTSVACFVGTVGADGLELAFLARTHSGAKLRTTGVLRGNFAWVSRAEVKVSPSTDPHFFENCISALLLWSVCCVKRQCLSQATQPEHRRRKRLAKFTCPGVATVHRSDRVPEEVGSLASRSPGQEAAETLNPNDAPEEFAARMGNPPIDVQGEHFHPGIASWGSRARIVRPAHKALNPPTSRKARIPTRACRCQGRARASVVPPARAVVLWRIPGPHK